MSLASLQRTEHPTRHGTIAFWRAKGPPRPDHPVLLTIVSPFAEPDALTRLPALLADSAEGVLMRFPGEGASRLATADPRTLAEALDEAIALGFPGRDVVLHGVYAGGLVALASRSPWVRRIVAVEPPLSPGKLWFQQAELRRRWREAPEDRPVLEAVFGVQETGLGPGDHRGLLQGLSVPAEVIAGEDPLAPERPVARHPSALDEADRAWLRSLAGVRVRTAGGAGHHIAADAPNALLTVLKEACAAIPAASALTEALLSRTPPWAERICWRGGQAEALELALRRRNPRRGLVEPRQAQVLLTTDPARDKAAVDQLPDGAWIIAAGEKVGRQLEALIAQGVQLVGLLPARAGEPAFDDLACDLAEAWRGGRLAAGLKLLAIARKSGTAPARLHLAALTFAPRLMDIRTRLPAHALRADPELVVSYAQAPLALTRAPKDLPKVRVLQRPALRGDEGWRRLMADQLRDGWVVVLEYDDHPDLVAEANKRTPGPDDWSRFGYVHGVQTTTRPLAEAFGRYNPEVRIFPNAVFDLPPFPDEPARRIFYGAVSRGAFAAEAARAISPALARHPDVEVVVIGDRAVFETLDTPNKRFHDFMPYEQYLEVMGTCAISLSPIEGKAHQDTKSDAKFLDASSRGALTLASPTIYAGTIRHGENGLIAETLADWAPLLDGVLADEGRRAAMARRAYDEVREGRMFADQAAERRAWYQSLWDRREALNAALLARLPGLAAALGR